MMELIEETELELTDRFKEIDRIEFLNSKKVLDAFKNNRLSESHFNATTGYGYNDEGRDVIEAIFAEVLGTEDAIVRTQFISGSHALTVALFSLLRPGDLLLSITGTPYDTLLKVIGITENDSSLKSFGVKYDQIELKDNEFDIAAIEEYLKNNKVKVIEIQRSKGYSSRKSLTVDKVEEVIERIRIVDKEAIIMIDNCYCEMVTDREPASADIIVGSLIKNLGGGIAPNGAYIAGRKDLVELAGERLTVPGCGKEVGPSLGINRAIAQGLFLAPSVVASSLKIAILTSRVLEKLGYEVYPLWNEERADIVQNIVFHDAEKLKSYCQGIQAGSPIDSYVTPEPGPMPGYHNEVIMASGSFTQGSSIELSCDGPLRDPFSAYQQGSMTYKYGKLGLLSALNKLNEKS